MRDRRVDLVDVVGSIHEQFTDTFFDGIWKRKRLRERARRWTLALLVRFWTDVVAYAPASLKAALAEAHGLPAGHFVTPQASPQAFFQRCQRLRPDFVAEVFFQFREAVTQGFPFAFAKPLHAIRRRFAGIEAMDASDLDAVGRRLKVLWKDDRVPLAGMIFGAYDICGGTLRDLRYEPHVGTSEFVLAVQALDRVPTGSLLVGDKLYGTPKFAEACAARGIFLLARHFSPVTVRRERLLSKTPHPDGGGIEDWRAVVGSGQTTKPQEVRLIRWVKRGKTGLELMTTVLDPKRLRASEAFLVYRHRWKVERLFADLKDVLNLRRFYAANPNAVALQLYATAIVHTAMRICQARIAKKARVVPDEISTKKLFPKLATTSHNLVTWHSAIAQVERLNPEVVLQKPDPHEMPGAYTSLSRILIEPRTSRKRPRHRPPAGWRSLPMPGRRKGRQS